MCMSICDFILSICLYVIVYLRRMVISVSIKLIIRVTSTLDFSFSRIV